MVKICPVGFARVCRREFVFPQQETEQRALEQLRRDVAAVVPVRQGGKVHMAIDQSFAERHASNVIGQSSSWGSHWRSAISFQITQNSELCARRSRLPREPFYRDPFEAAQVHLP